MAIITETYDSNINAYATGSFSIGFDDVFQGTFGGTDHQDGINLPVLEAGTTYTITMTVDDIADFHSMVIINPADFHSIGYHVTDGIPHNAADQMHYTGFMAVGNLQVEGNTISMEVTPTHTRMYSLAVQGINGPTESYEISIAETPTGPVITPEADDITGTSGADDYNLLAGDDTLTSGDGNDTATGANGNDYISGDAGDDLFSGDACDDTLNGGTGNDTLLGGRDADVLNGGDNDDELHGGNQDDVLSGDAGNDVLLGGTGNDDLDGGAGADTIEGGAGDDTMAGGTGADTFVVMPGNGQDVISDFENGTDVIDVTALGITDLSQITLTGDGANTTLTFSDGNTVLLEGVAWTDIDASDFVMVAAPMVGSGGNDVMNGGDTNDTLDGGAGADKLYGQDGNDSLLGGDGKDTLEGGIGNDTLDGGGKNDRLDGGAGNDVLSGGNNNDVLDGGMGDDALSGDQGNDKLNGGAGADTLEGGRGRDQLTGGADADTFVFASNGNDDTIMDFEDGLDMIDVSAIGSISGFGDLSVTQVGGNVLINLDGGNDLTLIGVNAADIDATDFIF